MLFLHGTIVNRVRHVGEPTSELAKKRAGRSCGLTRTHGSRNAAYQQSKAN
jgi:hypothetical protein